MTILQVCAYAAPYEGNFINSLKILGQSCEEKGIKMIYAFPETACNISWCQELEKITDVYYLPLARARIKIKTYKELIKIYNKYSDLEIIHSHFELYDAPISLTAPKNVKVFWHLHDALECYSDLKNRIAFKVQYGFCHKNAKLLAVSPKLMEYAIKQGFPRNNTCYIPNGLDIRRIRQVSSKNDKKEFDFLMFGWDFEIKGVDLCIEAVKMLNDPNVKVAIVGSSHTEKIIEEKYGNVIGINIIKPVKDINELYTKTKCFLHISRAEGLSYALLEAVYAGLQVICSDIEENRFAEVFPTVKMVKSENISDICSAMENVLQEPECFEEKVHISRKIIEEKYSISCWVKNMLKQYGVKD